MICNAKNVIILLLKLLIRAVSQQKMTRTFFEPDFWFRETGSFHLSLKFFIFYSFCQWDHPVPSCKLSSPWRRGLFFSGPLLSTHLLQLPRPHLPTLGSYAYILRGLGCESPPHQFSFPQKGHHTSPHMWVTETLSNKVM